MGDYMEFMNVNQSMPQDLFQVLTKVSLESLNTGDVLKGRVQALENGVLLIKLLDGQTFSAAVSDDFSANQGDLITLEIGPSLNDQLTARILSMESQAKSLANNQDVLANTIEASLESFGVSNAKELVDSVIQLLGSKPELNIEQASFIIANKLDQAPDMNDLLLKISEHEFSLHDNLQTLKEGLLDTIAGMDRESVANLLTPTIINQEVDDLSSQIRALFSNESNNISDSIIQNVKQLLTKTLMDELSKSDGKVHINKELIEAAIKDAVANASSDDEVNLANDMQKSTATQQNKGDVSLSQKSMFEILKIINKGLGRIHEKSGNIEKSDEGRFLKEIKTVLEKLFDNAFIKVEDGLIEKIDAKEKSQALKEVLQLAQDIIKNSDNTSKEQNLPLLKEIDTAFRFFEQVTTYNSIVHIPIKMNEQHATGELYVMKRKNRGRKIDTNNFTLFLSLTTKNLGVVESFLNTTHKRITIRFRLENQELVKLFDDNYRLLYDRLFEKGFTLVDMKCRIIDEDRANIVNASIKVEELLGTRTKLDLKI